MAVEHKRLGRKGVMVSNLCLGTMNFGLVTDEEESFKIMDRALELGVNFFDTADGYGWEVHSGYTEEVIGRWFAQGGGRREAVVLATKVYADMYPPHHRPEPNANSRSLSAMKIKKHCEASLRRLQTDWIDLYQMHHIDRQMPWAEAWQAFGSLLTQGKVVYVGSSNFAGWHIATATQEAEKRGFLGLVSEQSIYNLVNRHLELEVIPACKHYGMGLIPYAPVGGGLLAGILQKMANGRRATGHFNLHARIEALRSQLETYETFCHKIGHPPAEVALAWLLHNPVVTAPIIGPRTVEQLESAVRATEIVLDEETLQQLDAIFPGPGGEAPEAYCGW